MIVCWNYKLYSCATTDEVSDGFFFVKQKTEYELRISDWSSDVGSSDLRCGSGPAARSHLRRDHSLWAVISRRLAFQRSRRHPVCRTTTMRSRTGKPTSAHSLPPSRTVALTEVRNCICRGRRTS